MPRKRGAFAPVSAGVMPNDRCNGYVAAVNAAHVLVVGSMPELQSAIAGGSNGPHGYELYYNTEQDLAETLSTLQHINLPFLAAGPGWTPADVFEQLREKGLVSGKVRTVVWRRPNEPVYGET